MDLNGDGFIDILGGCFDGTPYIAYGGKDGLAQPTAVLDTQGRRVIISTYYDWETNKYSSADRSPEGATEKVIGHMVAATAFDWDDDGDYDLLLTDKSKGYLFLQENEGTPTEPKFTGVNHRVMTTDEDFPVTLGMIGAPCLVDWNGDGLTDILSFGFSSTIHGTIMVYPNVGKAGAPAFDKPRALLQKGGNGMSGAGKYFFACDIDGNGKLDLLVGNECQGNYKEKDKPSNTGVWLYLQADE